MSLYYHVPWIKKKIKMYQQHCSLENHRDCHYTQVIWHIFQWNNRPYCLHCVTLITTIYDLYMKLWRSKILMVTFPYILDSEVCVWNYCQTLIHISVRGDHLTVSYQTSWFFMIHLSGQGWILKNPFPKWYHFIPILFIKAVSNCKVYPKMWIRYYKCSG